MSGKLFVVGTPIGNLGDFSKRAVETLEAVDFIAAEDTRVTLKLLNHFDIKKPLISYFEHNKTYRGEIIAERILKGESCAIVTDAGMPAVSDPGEELVRRCRELSIPVESVPGPAAFVTALSVSGMKSGRFCFEGFLSVNKRERKKHLDSLRGEQRTMIFYEAPHKLLNTLEDMLDTFGDRKAAIARELTKLHEEVFITGLSDAVRHYKENAPRGEFVIIIEGALSDENYGEDSFSAEDAAALARRFIADGDSTASAAKKAAEATGCKKNEIYRMLIEDNSEN